MDIPAFLKDESDMLLEAPSPQFQPRGALRRAGAGRTVKGVPRPQSHRLPVDVSPDCDIRSCTKGDTIGQSVRRGPKAVTSQAMDKKVGSPTVVQESGFPKLYIGFLPGTATKEELAKRFQRCGSIANCFIVSPKNGDTFSYGFVKYDSVFSSLAAIHMLNGTQWGDCKICVKWSHTRKSSTSSYPEPKQKQGPELPPYSVCVKRIPLHTSEEMLRTLFSGVGTVKDVCIVKLKPLQETLYGFVQFSTLEEAQRAISHFNNFVIDPQCKQRIRVEMPHGKGRSPPMSYDELLVKRLHKSSVPIFAQVGVNECTTEITGSNCQLHLQPVVPEEVMDSWGRMAPPCPANIPSATASVHTTDSLLATPEVATITAASLQFSSTSRSQLDTETVPGLTSTDQESGTASDSDHSQQALANLDMSANASNCSEPCRRVEALIMSLKELPTLHPPISSPELSPEKEQDGIPPLESVESSAPLTHTESDSSDAESAVSSQQCSSVEKSQANIEEGPLTLSGTKLPTFHPPISSPKPSIEQEQDPLEHVEFLPQPPLESVESLPQPPLESVESLPQPPLETVEFSTPPPLEHAESSAPLPLGSVESSAPPPLETVQFSTPPPLETVQFSTPPPLERAESSAPPPLETVQFSTPPPLERAESSAPLPLGSVESSAPLTHTESDSRDGEGAVSSQQCSSPEQGQASNSSIEAGPSTPSGNELPTFHPPISSPEPSTDQAQGIPPLESVESPHTLSGKTPPPVCDRDGQEFSSEDEEEFQKSRRGRSTHEIEKNIAQQQRNIHRFQTELKRIVAKNEAIEVELSTEELGVTLPSGEIPPDILWEYDKVIDLHGQILTEKCRQKLSKSNFDELLLKAEQMLARDKLALMEVRLEVEAEEWLAKLRLAKLENRYLQTKADLLT